MISYKDKFKYKRVKIFWHDIITDPSWLELKDVDKLTCASCEDIGYLYYKDSKFVKIFTSYSYDGSNLTIGNITVLPRSVVFKIEVLK